MAVDFTSALNLFPTARFCNNSFPEYNATLTLVTSIMAKMAILGAQDFIVSLHRTPENNYNDQQVACCLLFVVCVSRTHLMFVVHGVLQQTLDDFAATLHWLSNTAPSYNVTVHLRYTSKNPQSSLQSLYSWLSTEQLLSTFLCGYVCTIGAAATNLVCFAEGHTGVNVIPSAALMTARFDSSSALTAVSPYTKFLSVAAPQARHRDPSNLFFVVLSVLVTCSCLRVPRSWMASCSCSARTARCL